MPRWPAAACLALALAACADERASAPGGVSPGEAKALDDAASMLDERQLPPEALPTEMPGEAPAAQSNPAPAPVPGAAPADLTGDAAPARN